MKKILVVLLSGSALSAFASNSNDSGFYAGLNLGVTRLDSRSNRNIYPQG